MNNKRLAEFLSEQLQIRKGIVVDQKLFEKLLMEFQTKFESDLYV
jgi:hypothetical protein